MLYYKLLSYSKFTIFICATPTKPVHEITNVKYMDLMLHSLSFLLGSFFLHYPRHRKLISINKRYTGIMKKTILFCLKLSLFRFNKF